MYVYELRITIAFISFVTAGVYTWTVPGDVFAISICLVGGGGGGASIDFPGTSGQASYFGNNSFLLAGGGAGGTLLGEDALGGQATFAIGVGYSGGRGAGAASSGSNSGGISNLFTIM